MFLKNKYSKIYFSIINNAKKEDRDKSKSYFEKHHIIPTSLNGSNYKRNLALLTAREHYICHLLLTKMVLDNSSMITAYLMMSHCKSTNQKRTYKVNARLYEIKKKEFSIIKSKEQSGSGNSNYGMVWISNMELKESKKVFKENIPDDWILGRIPDFNKLEILKNRILSGEKIKNLPENNSLLGKTIREFRKDYNIVKDKEILENKIKLYSEIYKYYDKFGWLKTKEDLFIKETKQALLIKLQKYVPDFKPQGGKKRGK